MGALHDGHSALLDELRRRSHVLVVSVFVNPLQFGPGEDLDRYPRTLESDLETCAAHDVDVVFTPDVGTVYPGGAPQVRIDPGPMGDVLEGATRPGHFGGVLTVVNKLLNLVQPDVAAFGEKDYQQLVLIRRMATDLNLSAEIVGVPTVREPDGLARSSRNRYLSSPQRTAALALSRALEAGAKAAVDGADAALAAAQHVLDATREAEVDYLVVTDPALVDPPASGPARMLVAAKVGATRLIDNIGLDLGGAAHPRRGDT